MIALGLLAIIPLALLGGVVLQDLWGWFIAGTFGVQGLSLAEAIGLSILVGYLTYQEDARGEDDRGLIETLAAGLFRILITWLFGAIVAAFL